MTLAGKEEEAGWHRSEDPLMAAQRPKWVASMSVEMEFQEWHEGDRPDFLAAGVDRLGSQAAMWAGHVVHTVRQKRSLL